MMVISCEDDHYLRAYARRLAQDGEDAYHMVIVKLLARQVVIRNIRAYCLTAIKYQLRKLARASYARDTQQYLWLTDAPPPQHQNLVYGRQKLVMCRKGLHPLIDGNLVYIDKQRTCHACKKLREAAGARQRRRQQRA